MSSSDDDSASPDSGENKDPTGLSTAKITRRTFLKASALGGAAVGVSAVGLNSVFAATASSQQQQQAESDPFASRTITLNVNGTEYTLQVEPRDMLVNVLRENLGLIATKRPCNRMECGGCTVLIDNVPCYSCTYLAVRAASPHQILTAEGGATDNVLATLQQAWVSADASQCGYCQPGRLMAATALLKNNPNPTVDEIKAGLEGVLCRCGTYLNVIEAVQAAAKTLGGT